MSYALIVLIVIVLFVFTYCLGLHAGRLEQSEEDLKLFDTNAIINYANRHGKSPDHRDGMMEMAAELQDRMITAHYKNK